MTQAQSDARMAHERERAEALSNDPDPFAAKRAEIDAALAKFMDGASIIEERGELDDDTAARANDFIAGAKKLLAEAEDARKAEKQPHLDAGRAVDASWERIKDRIQRVIGVVSPLLDRYLKRKDEARKAAAAEARRRAEEADAAARAAQQDAINAKNAAARIEAEERARESARIAAEQTAKAERAKAPARVESATGLTHRKSLRTVYGARIVSKAQALAHYRDRPEVEALILQMANAEMRHAPVVRGVKTIPQIPGIAFDADKVL